ncbi:trypsin-like serine peptidase [Methyloversatilis thermotolerans]|uniref:trypsin-like serine peptidase n=1 Tax=Methyloversatilis thermotolerans TaxID=1346290 RepID=UPI00035E2CAD|nr:hypothetical protein [Methyloversatilis thermotolerans]
MKRKHDQPSVAARAARLRQRSRPAARWAQACAIVSGLLPAAAQALIHGEPTPSVAVATVELVVEQWIWHGSTRGIVSGRNECSAVVVGRAPLTVLTAAHCLRDARLDPGNGLPVLRLQGGATVLPPLRHAVYRRFEDVDANLARDVAVLVFDGDAPDELGLMPLADHVDDDRAMLCGYGRGYTDKPLRQPRCAVKPLLAASDDFYRFVPQQYETLDPLLHLQFRAQFEAKHAVVEPAWALLAVNRVEDGQYRVALPMPTRGDSGGPWIVTDRDGRRGVFALTSFVETFYRKNKQWTFFNDSPGPLSDFPYAAYGVRLDTPEARALITRARALGADIRSLDGDATRRADAGGAR